MYCSKDRTIISGNLYIFTRQFNMKNLVRKLFFKLHTCETFTYSFYNYFLKFFAFAKCFLKIIQKHFIMFTNLH